MVGYGRHRSFPRVVVPAVAAVEGCGQEGELGGDALLGDADAVADVVLDVEIAAGDAHHEVGRVVVRTATVGEAGGVGGGVAVGVVRQDGEPLDLRGGCRRGCEVQSQQLGEGRFGRVLVGILGQEVHDVVAIALGDRN